MKRKIKVGIVNYHNTLPLINGLIKSPVINDLEIYLDYPARIAEKLIKDEIDIGLVPVTVLPKLPNAKIISDFCIGSDGKVATVCLFSDVLIHEIEKIYLDYQSNTSVALLKILLRDYWKVQPELLNKDEKFIEKIGGTTAGLVIGDRAFKLISKFKYSYDLGEVWKLHTGLPFVFAAWVANKEIPAEVIHDFNEANRNGVKDIMEVVKDHAFDLYDLEKYYKENISYELDEKKKEGLILFLSLVETI